MENKRKHLHWLAILGSTMLVTVGIFVVSFAAVTPQCDGIDATIWVDAGMLQPANVPYIGTINGTGNGDVIVGSTGADIINGNGGDDLICGDNGKDDINGGQGDDTIFGQGGKDTINGGSGNDTIEGGGKADTIYGSSGDDFIKGNGGADIICGNSGNDDLKGNGGNDKIDANGGMDEINGNNGTDICLDGDVSTSNCEDTVTDIVACNSLPIDPSESTSGGWKRCGTSRVRVTEDCPSVETLALKGAAEEEGDDDDDSVAQCLSLDVDRMAEFDLSEMVYYHDVAHAFYSTYATDTDPMQYFVEGVKSNDLMLNHLSINANGFTKYEAAIQWALLINCYQLSEDVMKQAADLGFIEEDADPGKRLSQEELLGLLMTVSELEADAYAPANYNPGLKVLRRDAWQWAVDVAMLTEKLDSKSREILKTFFETGDIPTEG